MIERIWCFEDHCPTAALGYYEGNIAWATERCEADANSLLGLVYRKRPQPQLQRAEFYYHKALALAPQHCEAASYMDELYLQTDDLPQASLAYARLQSLVASMDTLLCAQVLRQLTGHWTSKGWCPPSSAVGSSTSPCWDSIISDLFPICRETRTWRQLRKASRGQVMTGGLGKKMISHHIEVWVCVKKPECISQLRVSANLSHLVGDSLGDEDYMCFVFSEDTGKFIPWAANSMVHLVKPTVGFEDTLHAGPESHNRESMQNSP